MDQLKVTPLLDLSFSELETLIAELGEKPFRARQIFLWVWQRGANSYGEMTNIALPLREKLSAIAPLNRCAVDERAVSTDGTVKYLVELPDGLLVEAVGLPSSDGRLTACISTQVGCAMGCTFCATGALGLTRSLTSGEIADQVRLVAEDFGRRVTNVVVMGQGEPFANYEQVVRALKVINAPDGLGIGARHITVSTAGLLDGITRFGGEPEQYTLAVSLHSAVQETRDRIMPGLAGQPLSRLLKALNQYSAQSGRRPTLEYALVAGQSDSPEEVAALARFARSARAHVNLIPINVVAGSPAQPPSNDQALWVRDQLTVAGVNATLRRERGADIDAACGQLALRRKGMFSR